MSLLQVGKQAQRVSFTEETAVVNISPVQILIGNNVPDTPISPLGAFNLAPGKDYWLATIDGSTQTISLLKGLRGILPSASDIAFELIQSGLAQDIATDIGATGVPLLHGQSSLASVAGPTLLTPGASVTGTLSHINIGYEAFVSLQSSLVDVNAQASFELIFSDSASGDVVDRVAYVFWPSDQGITQFQQIYGKGPTRGNKIQFRLTNQGTNDPIQYQYLLTQSGRIYAYDLMRPLNAVQSSSGRGFPGTDVEVGILGSHTVTGLGTGASQVDQLPPYMGKCHIHFDSGSSAADCEVQISANDDSLHSLSSGIVYDQFTDSTGNRDADIVLPGTQCFITITNHNAAAKTVRYVVTETQY